MVLAAIAFHELFYARVADQRLAANHRAAQLRELLHNAIETRRLHVARKRELSDLTARISRTQKRIPGAPGESEFLSTATRVAADAGLQIEDYRRGQARHLATHSEVDIQLNAVGSHASICRFLMGMRALARAKCVKSLTISSGDDRQAYPCSVAYTLYFGLKT